jgi:hypothetical protein
MSPRNTVRREVRSDDPSLSPEANRLLTGELREAVGSDYVEVPEEALHRSEERHADHSRFVATLVANRLVLVTSLLVLLTIGIVLSLATGNWWALVIALAIHAVGTLGTATAAIHLTTEVEHVGPTTAALLEDEGVRDPDQVLSELVEDFAGATQAHGVAEFVSTGNNENAADPDRERAQAAVEQRTAMTPSAHSSSPAGSGSVIGAMPLAIVSALVVLTIVVAIAEGGVLWVLPAVTWAAAATWLAIVLRIDGRAEEAAARDGAPLTDHGPDRPTGDLRRGIRQRIVPIYAVVVTGAIGWAVFIVLLVTSLTGGASGTR